MKIVWKDILEGWKYDLFPPKHLEELIRQTQDERLAICLNCPFNSTEGKINSISYCKDCKCPLKKKTACLHCECPQKKWLAQLTEAESNELKNKNQ
jgi:hypothetical protein